MQLVPLFSLGFTSSFPGMKHIFSTTQKGYDLSYGLKVAIDYLGYKFEYKSSVFSLLPYALAFLLLVAAIYFGLKQRGQLVDIDLRHLRAFWASAGVYVGTFLLGNSWDYRFMFTLLAVPALAEWIQQKGRGSITIARMTTIVLLLSCWYLVLQKWFGSTETAYNVVFAIDELANWILFFGMACLSIASLPQWLVDEAQALLLRTHQKNDTHPRVLHLSEITL